MTDLLQYETVIIKQDAAITRVKDNLQKLADYIDEMPTVFDLSKSYGSSVIKVNPTATNFNSNALTKALDEEKSIIDFVDKYMAIIDSLESKYSDMVVNKYIKHKTSYDLRLGDDDVCGHSRYYKVLDEAYIQIALLDESINYTINDHLFVMKFENIQQSKAIHKLIVLFIRHNEINYDEYLDYLIHALPETLFTALDDYITNNYNTDTTYQYQLVRRAIFTLALNHKDIRYGVNDFYDDLRLTGSGWKKYYNTVIQPSLF